MAMEKQPFLSHVQELRTRLFWVAIVVVAGTFAGYVFYEQLLNIATAPLGQKLYFTKPGGGLELLIKICLLVGSLAGLPVLLYQLFNFLSPLLERTTRHFITWLSVFSVFLMASGVLFGYFVALPAALHFLLEFSTQEIQALITTDSYLSFILAYMAVSAIMFQLPIILLFFDRIKPLKPSALFAKQHWVILGSFIMAAIVTPTVDPINQCIIALPVILLYNLSVVFLTLFGRHRQSVKIQKKIDARKIFHTALPHYEFTPVYTAGPATGSAPAPPIPSAKSKVVPVRQTRTRAADDLGVRKPARTAVQRQIKRTPYSPPSDKSPLLAAENNPAQP